MALMSGCGSTVRSPDALTAPQLHAAKEQEYRIQAGDGLEVKFFYNPELNEQIIVRPDGRISLQLIGDLMAAGLTPAELTSLLVEKYSPELAQPKITIFLRSFAGNKVFVDGEVNGPGLQDLTGPLTLRQSIARAGGLKETARTNEIVIIRQQPNAGRVVITADLKKVNDGSDMSQDLHLQPYDIVYVPKSPIANLNLWVNQYIRNVLPVMPTSFFTSM